ncbi:MAG TPA: sigma 54-interacting transcriptional regulator [Vicinamibacterales bacterium]|nr:sigma 54-interacting transcriptional regulator [Vicinamibacterales bacterium]
MLAAANVAVVWADNVAYALNELQRREMPVLLDLSRGAAALQVARDIRTQRASTLMFAVVDTRRPDLTTEAVLAGMADVFARPLGGRRVANAIDRELAYEARSGSRPGGSDSAPRDRGEDLYGHSSAMRDVMTVITRAATMRAGVLIRGEEGTGRQVAARAIHAQQNGHAGRFVAIDCASTDGDDLDVALFGRINGNGEGSRGLERISTDSRLFDARGGTLYLQNVAEAPTRVQARLARVLRDREAVLAESGETVNFDVRPMAGVDPGIDGAVQEGRVRDDLFRRLSVIRIDMPPLRHRREDIPALANYFLREICASLRVPPKTLSRSALSLLSAMPWRGNGVELRTLLEQVITGLQGGRGIGLEDVLAHIRLDGGSVVFSNGGTLKQARSRFEREYIAATLEQHHGRISEAAKSLGIQRTNLYRKMRSLRVARSRR